MSNFDTDICIVGAGPVGLTLAMELGAAGHQVTILEMRLDDEISSPKSNHISARSMEIYRRLGVADRIRSKGLPDDYPNDAVYATRFTGKELTRFRMPSRRDRFNDAGFVDGELPSAERAARVSQMYLAPVLLDHALSYPNVEIRRGVRFEQLEQEADGVTVHTRTRVDDAADRIRCRYLIGADGARSDVRKFLGISLVGDDNLVRARSRLFRAPGLLDKCAYPRAWMNWFFTGGKWSTMMAIDGQELWLMHNFVPPGVALEDFDIDAGMREALGVEPDFTYETIRDEDWVGRRLVADRLQVGRCFIAGDAAHIWVPFGGYGMNAGIADVNNLAWMLDAVLSGWAPETLLQAHDQERRPITEQVSRLVASNVGVLDASESGLLEEEGPESDRLRQRFGEALYAANLHSMVPSGFNFGYSYADSPIVAHDGEIPPPLTMGTYIPTTVPSARAPHFRLADGRSLYDAVGRGFTLIRLDRGIEVDRLREAASVRGLPLTILDVEPGEGFDPKVYAQPLVLVRPDQHIAWRGTTPPDDPLSLIDLVRGASMSADAVSKAA